MWEIMCSWLHAYIYIHVGNVGNQVVLVTRLMKYKRWKCGKTSIEDKHFYCFHCFIISNVSVCSNVQCIPLFPGVPIFQCSNVFNVLIYFSCQFSYFNFYTRKIIDQYSLREKNSISLKV